MNLTPFDWTKARRTIIWITAAAIVGIATVADTVDWSTFSPIYFSWSAFCIAIFAVIRIGAGWLRQAIPAHQQTGFFSFLRLFLVPLAFALALAGCISSPWDQNPLKSSDKIRVEETPDGRFALTIKGSGDGVFSRDFTYKGSGPDPWQMTVAATVDLTSPALLRSFDSLDNAVHSLPPILDIVGPMPADPESRPSWAASLFAFLASNPHLLPRFLELLPLP